MVTTTTTSKSEKDIDQLKEDYASLKSDMADIASTLKKLSSHIAADGRAKVESVGKQTRAQAKESLDALEKEVGTHPLGSIATAFGIGFLIGKVFDR